MTRTIYRALELIIAEWLVDFFPHVLSIFVLFLLLPIRLVNCLFPTSLGTPRKNELLDFIYSFFVFYFINLCSCHYYFLWPSLGLFYCCFSNTLSGILSLLTDILSSLLIHALRIMDFHNYVLLSYVHLSFHGLRKTELYF